MATQKVQLMATCLVDAVAPEVGKATVRVLELARCEVGYPEGQTCCGQPAFNVGFVDEAREMARYTLDLFDETEGTIVIPSGSCAAMVIEHYPEILEGTDYEDKAKRVAGRTRELSQFLVHDRGATGFDAVCDGCTITVHRSCHGLRNLGVRGEVDELVRSIAGAEVVPLEGAEECCGFGGLFSVEMPDVSAAIMRQKLDNVEDSGANILVGGDISCLLHLEGGLRRRNSKVAVRHFVEMIGGDDGA
ncbi:MAG: (Fe-S)-binding protein [Actinobacteria bacterium]|nr:MAG: (Fe-S)-binding protein [Actinomycetota bacterium]